MGSAISLNILLDSNFLMIFNGPGSLIIGKVAEGARSTTNAALEKVHKVSVNKSMSAGVSLKIKISASIRRVDLD